MSKNIDAGLNPAGHPSPLNLPNAITVARIALVPLFIWLSLTLPITDMTTLSGWWTVTVFVLAIATDGVDGAIARRRGLVTNLGKILDPIADKALTGAGFLLLVYFGQAPLWAVALILLREIGITIFRLIVVRRRVIAASGGGKLKTVLQAVVIAVMLSPLMTVSFVPPFAELLFWITAGITIFTGVQYLWAEFGRKPSPAAEVLALAEEKNVRLAVSESLTGGMLASQLASVPGASRVFLGGAVVYSNRAKVALSGVPEATIHHQGAVSLQAAEELAAGIAAKLGEAGEQVIGVSATGVAGPDSLEGKPVGTVFIGLARGTKVTAREFRFSGSRQQIRSAAVAAALAMISEELKR